MQPTNQRTHFIAIRYRDGKRIEEPVPTGQITHFKADHKYTTGYYAGGELLLDDTLKALAGEFPGEFLQPHRSFLVRRECIESVSTKNSPVSGEKYQVLHLRGASEPVPVSRRGWDTHKKQLQELKR